MINTQNNSNNMLFRITNLGVTEPKTDVAVSESTEIARCKYFGFYTPKFDDTPIKRVFVPDSATTLKGSLTYMLFTMSGRTYQAVENQGVKRTGARQIDYCLAKYSKKVADEMKTGGYCYTGVKWALQNAGILKDYSDMPKGSASDAISYFEQNKDKFEKLNVKAKNLKKLPAGMIIVYTKEGADGHIAITNGYGQEMSDCTDNMRWLDAKGDGANFVVYRLTDGWSYNNATKKLEFSSTKG